MKTPSTEYHLVYGNDEKIMRPSSNVSWYAPVEGAFTAVLREGPAPSPWMGRQWPCPLGSEGRAARVTLNDGRLMPRLGLGLYKVPPGTDAEAAVRCALDAGYRHIDTAAIYGNEGDVGRAIAASGLPREEIWVTTKFYPKFQHGSEEVAEECRASVAALGLDYIDLYLVHTPAGRAGRDETWQGMERLLAEGLVRSIGVSNYGSHQLRHLLASCSTKPAVNQVELSPFLQRDDLVELCEEHEVVLVAYSPLTKGTMLDNPKLQATAEEVKCTAAQLLLKWCIQRGFAVLPRSTNPQHMEENAQALDVVLEQSVMEILNTWDSYSPTGWDPTADE